MTLGAALVALLIVPAFAAPALGSPVALGGSATQQWAYGGQKWVNATVTLPNATLTYRAFFGWQVVFTATNTTLTTQAWEAQRTMAGHLYVDYCQPNCSAPTTHGNVSLSGWEVDAGFANLTAAGSVYENGSAVPAVALLNASFENAANLSESFSYMSTGGLLSGSTSAALDVAGAAHGTVQFSPSLGLVPLNLTPGTHWNSSSAYSAAGGWSVVYTASHTGFNGSLSSSTATASGGVNSSGTIQLYGADLGTVTLNNGLAVPAVVLVWSGPFDDVDGVILIPHDFDLFDGGGHIWDHEGFGGESVATSTLDFNVDADHHLKLVAAASSYGSEATSVPGATPVLAPATAGPTPSATSPTVVQAQPESVTQAQSSAACLTGTCATSSPVRAVLGLYVGLVVVGVVVAGVAGLLIYLRGRRRGGSSAVAPPPGAVEPSSTGLPRSP